MGNKVGQIVIKLLHIILFNNFIIFLPFYHPVFLAISLLPRHLDAELLCPKNLHLNPQYLPRPLSFEHVFKSLFSATCTRMAHFPGSKLAMKQTESTKKRKRITK